MTAYSKTDLYNKLVQEQASEAFRQQHISDESYRRILEAHPEQLYTPNYFIRIALGLLAIVAIILSGFLTWLITNTSSDDGFAALFLFFAVVCYGFLELMIKTKKFYNAGLDNVLSAFVIIFTASCFLINNFAYQYETIIGVIMLLSLWMMIRFTDAFMAMIFYLSALVFFFLLYIKLQSFGRYTAPFALILFSAIVYFVVQKLLQKKSLILYKHCFNWITFLTLLSLYAAGNYFVINELSIQMFKSGITMGWLFWATTFIIPVFYVLYGLQKRRPMFYRTGIVLLALSVLTVRYYHTIMPAEVAMLVFGLLLIVISYAVIKYLSIPKHGFTFEDDGTTDKGILNTEALIIAQIFTKRNTNVQGGVEFGGGSGGGGGASGNY